MLLLHLLLLLLPAQTTLLSARAPHQLQRQLPIVPSSCSCSWLAGAGALDRQLPSACSTAQQHRRMSRGSRGCLHGLKSLATGKLLCICLCYCMTSQQAAPPISNKYHCCSTATHGVSNLVPDRICCGKGRAPLTGSVVGIRAVCTHRPHILCRPEQAQQLTTPGPLPPCPSPRCCCCSRPCRQQAPGVDLHAQDGLLLVGHGTATLASSSCRAWHGPLGWAGCGQLGLVQHPLAVQLAPVAGGGTGRWRRGMVVDKQLVACTGRTCGHCTHVCWISNSRRQVSATTTTAGPMCPAAHVTCSPSLHPRPKICPA